MGNWYKTSQLDTLSKKIKDHIREDGFLVKMFDIYDVPLDFLDDKLSIEFKKLDDQYAKSNKDTIYLDYKVFNEADSFDDLMHFVVHEMVHWLTRQRESLNYFADPEEMEAFALGIAYEIGRGKSEEEIRDIYMPIIENNFSDGKDNEILYKRLLHHAGKIRSMINDNK